MKLQFVGGPMDGQSHFATGPIHSLHIAYYGPVPYPDALENPNMRTLVGWGEFEYRHEGDTLVYVGWKPLYKTETA